TAPDQKRVAGRGRPESHLAGSHRRPAAGNVQVRPPRRLADTSHRRGRCPRRAVAHAPGESPEQRRLVRGRAPTEILGGEQPDAWDSAPPGGRVTQSRWGAIPGTTGGCRGPGAGRSKRRSRLALKGEPAMRTLRSVPES